MLCDGSSSCCTLHLLGVVAGHLLLAFRFSEWSSNTASSETGYHVRSHHATMASSSTAPSTPEQLSTPRRVAMNRSFTVPPKLAATRATQPEIGAAEGIETLYVHPRANIVKFTTGSLSRPSSAGSPRARQQQGDTGTLPWKVAGESTLAAGPLEIYRVPGSVSFLHSGALLHAILPRSQCWCVDGVSIFALRVLADTYYRIELPGDTPEDLERVEALKVTLKKVLFFERTPCPFAREFTVELPEQDEKAVKLGRRKSSGPAKKWRLQKAYSWKPEGWEGDLTEDVRERQASAGSTEEDEETDSADVSQDDVKPIPRRDSREEEVVAPKMPTRTPVRELAALRSVTAPPQLSLRSTPPSRIGEPVTLERPSQAPRRSDSPGVGKIDAKRLSTFQAIPTDMPPSPPDSSAGAESRDLNGEAPEQPTENDPIESFGEDQDTGVASSDAETTKLPDRGLAQPAETHSKQQDEDHQSDDPMASGEEQQAAPSPEIIPYDEGSLPRSLAVDQSKVDEQSTRHNDLSHANALNKFKTAESIPSIDKEETKPPKSAKHERMRTPSDPYAAIQARIEARRSIGGANLASTQSAASKSSSSSASSSTTTIASRLSAKPSRPNLNNQRSLTTALVNKACAIFLGPPAHLVALMLKIAARFADGAFGNVFLVESPLGSPRRVPGSFYVDEEDEDLAYGDEEEDDFGVPLRSPVRVTGLRERGANARHAWGVE